MAEKAFLSIWSSFTRWHEDLVLLGGLVPRFICNPLPPNSPLKMATTIDVDLGIALGTESGQYDPISVALRGQGFRQDPASRHRHIKTVSGVDVPVDFLVESPGSDQGTVAVDDIAASVMLGVDRAIATAQVIDIEGEDLMGARQQVRARVCDAGPFIALKLRSFLNRQHGKDVFDILYTVRQYKAGAAAAIRSFGAEVHAGNPASADAIKCLQTLFEDERTPGPVRASHFLFGEETASEDADSAFHRTSIKQQMVEIAKALRETTQ